MDTQTQKLLKACLPHIPADLRAMIEAKLSQPPKRSKKKSTIPYGRCEVTFADGMVMRAGTFFADKTGAHDWAHCARWATVVRATSTVFGPVKLAWQKRADGRPFFGPIARAVPAVVDIRPLESGE
jgi:hypothetical protein